MQKLSVEKRVLDREPPQVLEIGWAEVRERGGSNQASDSVGRPLGRRVNYSVDGQGVEARTSGIEQEVIEADGLNEERAGSSKRSEKALHPN